jgi:hypothetical protein
VRASAAVPQQQHLPEPQRETLLADAARTLQEQTRGQRVARARGQEARASRIVSVKGGDRHAPI